jgi:hypothetical protein
MNTPKYEERLPQLRVSKDIYEKLEGYAFARGITLAEAHRDVLARGLDRGRIVTVPIVGRIITDEQGKPQMVVNLPEGGTA